MSFRRLGAFRPSRAAVLCASVLCVWAAVAGFGPPTKVEAQKFGTALASTVAAPTFPHAAAGWSLPERETLTYSVDWRVFPAGSATVHLESEGPLEHITVVGDSTGAINLLFRVSDRFQSTLDRNTGCSESFSRQIIEGRRQVQSQERIDGARGVAQFEEQNLVARRRRQATVVIPRCVSDLLSSIFYVGSQPLEPGSTFVLPVVSGNHVTNVVVRAEARETVRTPTTTYHTIRVQPTADGYPVHNRGKLWIWYSDDARHIPVQMRARLFWGTLTFRLTGIDNK